MTGRPPALEPGTYGKVSTGIESHCRGIYAAARVRLAGGERRVVKRRGATSAEAIRHLREHLHALGLRDGRIAV